MIKFTLVILQAHSLQTTRSIGTSYPQEEALKIVLYLQENLLDRSFFSAQFQVQYLPGILIETDPTTEVFLYGFSKTVFFKSWKNFWRDIFIISFLIKLQASNLQVVTSLKTICLAKMYTTNFWFLRLFILCIRQRIYLNTKGDDNFDAQFFK